MEAEQIYEVVKTLVGPIRPVADSAIDSKRQENLEKFSQKKIWKKMLLWVI